MAYKPYKMKGHTLPGINQREGHPKVAVEGLAASSPLQKQKPFAKHGQGTDWAHTHMERVAHGDGAAVHNKVKKREEVVKKDPEKVVKMKKMSDLTPAEIKAMKLDKPIGNKPSPNKWVQAVAALAPMVTDMMKKKKE